MKGRIPPADPGVRALIRSARASQLSRRNLLSIGAAGASACLRLSELMTFTATKMAKATIRKSTMVWMKAPYFTSTAATSAPAASTVAGLSSKASSLKFTPPTA